MATTKIWPVRDNLKRVLDYAENHLKTANPNAYTEKELKDLHDVLSYAVNGKLQDYNPKIIADSEELRQFIEMCFDPSSPVSERMKQTMIEMFLKGSGDDPT